MEVVEEPFIRDTSAQDVAIDPTLLIRRRRRLLVASAIGALAIVVAMVMLVQSWASTDIVVPLERVRIAPVTRGVFIRDVAAQGTVVVADSPTLFASAVGTVTFIVRAGDSVSEGQVLATVDSPSLRSEHALEKATLDGLITSLDRATIDAKRRMLESKQAADLATTQLRATQREFERQQAAWKEGVIPRRDLDRAQDARDDAHLVYEHSNESAKLHQESLNFELKTMRLDIGRQKLAVAELARRVDALTVKSPVKGVVGSLAVNQKAAVNENAALLTVVDLSALEVEFRVAESYAADLAPDMRAEIDYAGRKYPGVITNISPEVQQSEVRGRVRFADNLPPGVRQNQRVNVRLVLDQRENALKVERGAFVGAGSFAYVVEGDMAQRRPIEFGVMSTGEVEILSGLNEGETIVVSSVEDFANAPEARLVD